MNTFKVEDFNQRWLKARTSALCKAFEKSENSLQSSEAELFGQYFMQVAAASPEEGIKKKDLLLRLVFDHSRLLAMSLSKFLGVTFEIQDFQDLLEKSEIPCVQGQWDSRKTAKVLSRQGCDFCSKSGAYACDYWREALDGLVMGLGDKERLARHASVRHGDGACLDVFYFDPPEENEDTSQAWGPIPEAMAAKLLEICGDFESKMKTAVLLKGLREGVLYFEFKSSTDTLCSGGQILVSAFQRKIQKYFPVLRIQEVTPRAVLGVE